ncbi:hypothetical protein PMI04_015085 [Sphingobium sp. AP49]|uniref:hypothetical protein n=1 Tax=Sphingobium sp. AP49 TaxID=1144307 RepID=UPI00026ED971|nr:hypothetical protein [Sphingobium sp. AP49]WHO37884.1 hypothetical protein PMI04_015085 [Sphingobium sp. AP49]
MAVNDYGIRLWDEAGALVFDTSDYSGRYVDSLTFTGPAHANYIVSGKPAESQLWIKVEFYNATPVELAQAVVVIIAPATISYDLTQLPSGVVTVIHYGWR